MPYMDEAGWIFWGIAAMVAVTSLVTMMRARRDELLHELEAEAEKQKELRAAEQAAQTGRTEPTRLSGRMQTRQ